jgi:hypothetical protein
MKPLPQKLRIPSTPPIELELPLNGYAAKLDLIGQALNGLIASDNADGAGLEHDDEWYAAKAYDIGAATFELYVQEDLSAVRRFNRKVGV